MNRIDVTLGHSGFARLEAIAAVFPAFFLKIHRGWTAARSRHELRALSDRTLKDIGLQRGQIDALFR